MKRYLYPFIILLCSFTLLSACRSNSGNAEPTKVTVKLIASQGTTIYGIDMTMNLAPGVTLKSSNPPQTDEGTIIVSGQTGTKTAVVGTYTPASGDTPGRVRLLFVDGEGFDGGEFAIVNGDIAPGHWPKSSDFSLANFSASDGEGNVISGVMPGFTVQTD